MNYAIMSSVVDGNQAADRLEQKMELTDAMLSAAQEIEIVSGEGTGSGTCETFTGRRTVRAIKARLTRERCGGDRWAFVKVDGQRV